MVQHLIGRKGAARIALIPPEVLEALNDGLVPTVNLNEFLALDLARLARNVARQIGLEPQAERIADTLAMLGAFKPVKRHEHVSRALYDLARAARRPRCDRRMRLATHPSDVARSWATQWIMFSGMPLPDKLRRVRRFAADPHFGVREMAWMAVRDEVAGAVDEAVGLLEPWAHDRDANIRRFASEAHAAARRLVRADRGAEGPALAGAAAARAAEGRPEPLCPELGRQLAQRREQDAAAVGRRGVPALAGESRAPATDYIVRRALRTSARRSM